MSFFLLYLLVLIFSTLVPLTSSKTKEDVGMFLHLSPFIQDTPIPITGKYYEFRTTTASDAYVLRTWSSPAGRSEIKSKEFGTRPAWSPFMVELRSGRRSTKVEFEVFEEGDRGLSIPRIKIEATVSKKGKLKAVTVVDNSFPPQAPGHSFPVVEFETAIGPHPSTLLGKEEMLLNVHLYDLTLKIEEKNRPPRVDQYVTLTTQSLQDALGPYSKYPQFHEHIPDLIAFSSEEPYVHLLLTDYDTWNYNVHLQAGKPNVLTIILDLGGGVDLTNLNQRGIYVISCSILKTCQVTELVLDRVGMWLTLFKEAKDKSKHMSKKHSRRSRSRSSSRTSRHRR